MIEIFIFKLIKLKSEWTNLYESKQTDRTLTFHFTKIANVELNLKSLV